MKRALVLIAFLLIGSLSYAQSDSMTAGEHLLRAQQLNNSGMAYQLFGGVVGTGALVLIVREPDVPQRNFLYIVSGAGYVATIAGTLMRIAAWNHIGEAGKKLNVASQGVGISYKF